MLAKYQKQNDDANVPDEGESPLDQALPPPILPTLNTLTNETTSTTDTPADAPNEPPSAQTSDEINSEILPKDTQVDTMGAGLSKEDENAVVAFLKGVWYEFRAIEWTPWDRVVRLTILVIVIVTIATAALYVVDGFLSRIAKALFEESF